MFRDKDPDSELVMIDFGLSKHFTFGEMHSEAVGTPYTVAPEVIRGRYDERCDVWAIGELNGICLREEREEVWNSLGVKCLFYFANARHPVFF